jgi:D-amino-acid dehydrogenase
MNTDGATDFTIIGAGIVGISCALFLQDEGFTVTVIERGDSGGAASSGNSGHLGTASIPPTGLPGLARRLPAMLLDPLAPLKIHWRHLPNLFPWLAGMLRHSRPERVQAIADARHALLCRVYAAYEPLLASAGLRALRRSVGKLVVYQHASTLAAQAYSMRLRRERGIRMEVLDAGQARQMEPDLRQDFDCAVWFPDVDTIANPQRLVQGLAAHFVDRGGRIVQDDVIGFIAGQAGPSGVIGRRARYDCRQLVIAAGAWSGALARQLGTNLPIEAERGYHVTIRDPAVQFRRPVALAERHLGMTPMEDGLRITGMAELAGLTASADLSRAETLLRQARAALPGLGGSATSFWMGARPSLPDSLPAIGRSARHDTVFFACGHDHLGLTMGPLTGRLIAQLAAGRPPELDLTPYRPERFA